MMHSRMRPRKCGGRVCFNALLVLSSEEQKIKRANYLATVRPLSTHNKILRSPDPSPCS